MKQHKQLSPPDMKDWTDEQIAEFWSTHDSADFWDVTEPVDMIVQRRGGQFFVAKTGLDAFDVARAWGLAVLLNTLTEDEVELCNADWAIIVKPTNSIPHNAALAGLGWRTLFVAEDVEWQRVFITMRERQERVQKVQKVLESKWRTLMNQLQQPSNAVKIGQGETLPGGLEPSAFKGLRHDTKARYREEQLRVPEEHWALACLGMATCGVYRFSREAGQDKWLALLPIPQLVRFNYFRGGQELLRLPSVRYQSVQNAAAHYAVQLAEQLRKRAAAQESLQDRFAAVLYFTLFGARQQIKPAQGNQLNLSPLMEAIQRDSRGAEAMFKWLDYCFRLGATEGAEDLALAATELVMRWDLDAFERLVRIFVRLIAQKRVRYDNLPDETVIRRVMRHVAA